MTIPNPQPATTQASGPTHPNAPRACLSRRYRFSASHRLHAESFTPAQNLAAFGKCANPHGHGHNYTVEVTFAGPVSPVTGMVCDLGELDSFAQTNLLACFDHMNLNTLPAFHALVPTTENLTLEVSRIFQQFTGAQLHAVRIEETGNNSFEYLPAPQKGQTA